MKEKIKFNPIKNSDETDNLREEFEKTKATPTHRKVKVRYYLQETGWCGCGGGHWITVERIVRTDSTLKDGMRVSSLKKGDKQIR